MTSRGSRTSRGQQRVGIVEGWELRRGHAESANSGAWKGLAFVVIGIIVLVVGGWFAIRPVLGPTVTDLFQQNPSFIVRVPVLADLLRAELADRINKPASSEDQPVKVVIELGESLDDIQADLTDKGLLSDDLAFTYLIMDGRVDQLIQAGTYTMSTNWSPSQIVSRLASSPDPPTPVVTLALRAGLRIEQIVAYLQQQVDETGLELDPKAFRDLALEPPDSLRDEYRFLRQSPKGNSLEGFLAGGVYEVPVDIDADSFLHLLLDQWEEDAGDLVTQVRNKNVDFYEALIIASLVEREVKKDAERPKVAAVYWNRLNPKLNKSTAGLMQADPTVVYAADTMELADMSIKDWPGHLFWDTLGVDLNSVNVPSALSSFQTYQNAGLPDWPIDTPSKASIQAALNPAKSKQLFLYSCPGKDTHKFAKNANGHQRNIDSCT